MIFIGTYYPQDAKVESIAYISRNNGALISKMIELKKAGVKYNLTRSPQLIFELPLILMSFKYKGEIRSQQYRYLQKDVNDWHERLDPSRPSLFKHIKEAHPKDKEIASAMTMISNVEASAIWDIYNDAKSHQNDKATHRITLTTAHSSKGMTYSEVYIDDDLNLTLKKILQKETIHTMSESDRTEFLLYYVAVSRCETKLHNATYL